jgi:hypothetical protein
MGRFISTMSALAIGLVVTSTASAGAPPGHAFGRNDLAPGLHHCDRKHAPGHAFGRNDEAPGHAFGRDDATPGNAFGRNGFHPWWRNSSTPPPSPPPGHAFGQNGNRPWWKKIFGGNN